MNGADTLKEPGAGLSETGVKGACFSSLSRCYVLIPFGGRSGCCLPDEVIGFQWLVWNQGLVVWRLEVVGRSERVLGWWRVAELGSSLAPPASHLAY